MSTPPSRRPAGRRPGAARQQAQSPVLRIDMSRPIPPYEQLRAQLTALVAAGQLSAGSQLPSVRQLAGDLGLAPGTVARAYSELEVDGVLVTRPRGGTYVCDQPASPRDDGRLRALSTAADAFVATVRRLGFGSESAEIALRQAMARSDGNH
jgi:GntR family transcriptional regulator